MADIKIRAKANLNRVNCGEWRINSELYKESDIINQQLGEYLSKLSLFSLPSSRSFLVRIKNGKENNLNAPIFYDQMNNRYVLITNLIKEKNLIDLSQFCYLFGEDNLNNKLNNLRKECDNDEEHSNLMEEMIRETLIDFFMGQYGRGFAKDTYLSKTNGLHIASVYGFGNSYDFNETSKDKESCDSVFGKLSLDEFSQLLNFSKYKKIYLAMLAGYDFYYIFNCFYNEKAFIEISHEQKREYINYAKEKQASLTRILK